MTLDPPAARNVAFVNVFLLSLANQETALNDVIVTTLVGLREVWMQSREVDEIRTVFIIIII